MNKTGPPGLPIMKNGDEFDIGFMAIFAGPLPFDAQASPLGYGKMSDNIVPPLFGMTIGMPSG